MTDATAFIDWLDQQPGASLPFNADTGQLDLRLCLRMFELIPAIAEGMRLEGPSEYARAISLVAYEAARDANIAEAKSRLVARDDYRHEFDSSQTCNYCGIAAERSRPNDICPSRAPQEFYAKEDAIRKADSATSVVVTLHEQGVGKISAAAFIATGTDRRRLLEDLADLKEDEIDWRFGD